jgi:hypothetical protein
MAVSCSKLTRREKRMLPLWFLIGCCYLVLSWSQSGVPMPTTSGTDPKISDYPEKKNETVIVVHGHSGIISREDRLLVLRERKRREALVFKKNQTTTTAIPSPSITRPTLPTPRTAALDSKSRRVRRKKSGRRHHRLGGKLISRFAQLRMERSHDNPHQK